MTLKLIKITLTSGQTGFGNLANSKSIITVGEFEKLNAAVPFISAALSGQIMTAEAVSLSGQAAEVLILKQDCTYSGAIVWVSNLSISGSVLHMLVEGY